MLIIQSHISRSDLQNNRSVLYLFGDNHCRVGYGGQAKEMRGEINGIGIRTKWRPGYSVKDFFNDKDRDKVISMWEDDFSEPIDHHRAGGVVVIPSAGLGTGYSQMDTRCPLLYQTLLEMIELAFGDQ